MKTFLLSFVLMLASLAGSKAQDIDISDKFKSPVFKRVLWKNKIIADTSRILLSEVCHLKELKLYGFQAFVHSFAGLEYFSELEVLQLSNEAYYCTSADSVRLDLSKNTALKQLICDNLNIYSLNISQCPELESLQCLNNLLDTLDVSRQLKLKKLVCGATSDFSRKDIHECLQHIIFPEENIGIKSTDYPLDTLICECGKLKSLGVQHCPRLTYLNCSYNRIRTLDLSRNPRLRSVIVEKQTDQSLLSEEGRSGLLEALILPDNTESQQGLTVLKCDDNHLKELDLSRSVHLQELDCKFNFLKKLDTSHNPHLRELCCDYNYIGSLNLSHNPLLEKIHCGGQGYQWIRQKGKDYKLLKELILPDQRKNRPGTRLKELGYNDSDLAKPIDLKCLPELRYLNCADNGLKKLNTRYNPELKELYCHSNSIRSLNLSRNPHLTTLNIQWMPLRKLDLTKNPQFATLACLNSPDRGKLILILSQDTDIEQIDFKLRYVENELTKKKGYEWITLPPKYMIIRRK